MANSQTGKTRQKWRNKKGQFVRGHPGGPGRPKGQPDGATIDGKRVKAEILHSWGEVDGPAILRRVAQEDPRTYLGLIIKCVPREEAGATDGLLKLRNGLEGLVELVLESLQEEGFDCSPIVVIERVRRKLAGEDTLATDRIQDQQWLEIMGLSEGDFRPDPQTVEDRETALPQRD